MLTICLVSSLLSSLVILLYKSFISKEKYILQLKLSCASIYQDWIQQNLFIL